MRRNRKIREIRSNSLLKQRIVSLSNQNLKIIVSSSAPLQTSVKTKKKFKKARRVILLQNNYKEQKFHNSSAFSLEKFKSFHEFQTKKQFVIVHVIESLGIGGAQTMMCELINGLNHYYDKNVDNICVFLNSKTVKGQGELLKTYGIKFESLTFPKFKNFLEQNKVNIVVQHRINLSINIKHLLPPKTKYVLINHTWHSSDKLLMFNECDVYVDVCSFFKSHIVYPSNVHETRKLVILNGIENNYIHKIESFKKNGFRTGRCHRLVPDKFNTNYFKNMNNHIYKENTSYNHHIIGTSNRIEKALKNYPWLNYHGSIINRTKKMSIIKSFDLYYYETFANEGASIAVLESLACGVPVVCSKYGGNIELVNHKHNGWICKNTNEYMGYIKKCMNDDKLMIKMKEQTIKDFNDRLHIKHCASKYMQIFDKL